MLYAFRIVNGIEQDHAGRTIDAKGQSIALHRIRERLAHSFGGYTETDSRGGWVGPDGLVEESGKCWDVFVASASAESARIEAIDAADWVRRQFDQQSVCLIGPAGSVEFIER